MDQHINLYRIVIRGKKWWLCILTWMIDASLQNAWLPWQMRGEKKSQKIFKSEEAMTYSKSCQNKPKERRQRLSNMPGDDFARFYQKRHFVILIPDNKR